MKYLNRFTSFSLALVLGLSASPAYAGFGFGGGVPTAEHCSQLEGDHAERCMKRVEFHQQFIAACGERPERTDADVWTAWKDCKHTKKQELRASGDFMPKMHRGRRGKHGGREFRHNNLQNVPEDVQVQIKSLMEQIRVLMEQYKN